MRGDHDPSNVAESMQTGGAAVRIPSAGEWCAHRDRRPRTLERSKTSAAIGATLGMGIPGTAFLAGSVFAIEGDLIALSVHPPIDEQNDIVYDGAEQATCLLA
jgi:hypothetical protein